MEQQQGITPAQKYCTACGRVLDARAEICPGCGIRQPLTSLPAGLRAASSGSERVAPIPAAGPSVPAVILALAGAFVRPIWGMLEAGRFDFAFLTYGGDLIWTVPVVGITVLYAANRWSALLLGGVIAGFGAWQFIDASYWLWTFSEDPQYTPWWGNSAAVAQGALVLAAGLAAAFKARPISRASSRPN